MGISLFKIFALFGIISAWAETALSDGKVTLVEAVDLVSQLCGVLGITPELELPGSEPTEEEVISHTSIVSPDASDDKDLANAERGPPDEESPKLARLDI